MSTIMRFMLLAFVVIRFGCLPPVCLANEGDPERAVVAIWASEHSAAVPFIARGRYRSRDGGCDPQSSH